MKADKQLPSDVYCWTHMVVLGPNVMGWRRQMCYVRAGDTLQVTFMGRLGRDTYDLYNVVAELTDQGVVVEFVNERVAVDQYGSSSLDPLMLAILATFAEFVRRRIKERQTEDIALAKTKGKYVTAAQAQR